MPNMNEWIRYYGTFGPEAEGKQVAHVDLELVIEDSVIQDDKNKDTPLLITDIQFQPGERLTGWVPSTSEMMEKLRYVNDENTFAVTGAVHEGRPPTTWNMDKRLFNIIGRGHEVICFPNYYPEDWDVDPLPTGLDITLHAKEDFDLMRISTATGVLLPLGKGVYDPIIEAYPDSAWVRNTFREHPLHYRYTREAWVKGGVGSAHKPIRVFASTRILDFDGNKIPAQGRQEIDVDGYTLRTGRNQFLTLPKGSIRFRIEFYKKVVNGMDGSYYLADTGIGYYGKAEFEQWVYGRSRY